MRLADRFDSGLRIRRTDAPASKEGGLWKTEDGQATFTDGAGNKFWFIDTTGGNVTVNLPDADEVTPDTRFTVIRTTAGANTLTVQSAVGNINGAGTSSIASQYASETYVSDGANFYKI